MLQFPKDISDTRILLTNDDGIHAEGLSVLATIAKSLSSDVWIVAPETEQSGAGHSLTLHLPLRVRKLGPRKFAVSGTPTDCVLLAVKEIVPKKKPIGLILSGINRSSNVAEDVTYSGTIAAAMEGTLLDVPSIALSQTLGDGPIHWKTAEYYLPKILKKLQGFPFPEANLLNINFPDRPVEKVRGVEIAPQGRRKIADKLDARVDPKGRPYYWIGGTGYDGVSGTAGMDYTLLADGYVTITPLHMDLTNQPIMAELRRTLTFPRK